MQKVAPTDLERAVVSLTQAAQWAAGFDVRLALEFRGSSSFCASLDTAVGLVAACGEPNENSGVRASWTEPLFVSTPPRSPRAGEKGKPGNAAPWIVLPSARQLNPSSLKASRATSATCICRSTCCGFTSASESRLITRPLGAKAAATAAAPGIRFSLDTVPRTMMASWAACTWMSSRGAICRRRSVRSAMSPCTTTSKKSVLSG